MAEPTTTSSPAELLARVPSAFEAAHKSGELFFFPSTARLVAGEFPVSPARLRSAATQLRPGTIAYAPT